MHIHPHHCQRSLITHFSQCCCSAESEWSSWHPRHLLSDNSVWRSFRRSSDAMEAKQETSEGISSTYFDLACQEPSFWTSKQREVEIELRSVADTSGKTKKKKAIKGRYYHEASTMTFFKPAGRPSIGARLASVKYFQPSRIRRTCSRKNQLTLLRNRFRNRLFGPSIAVQGRSGEQMTKNVTNRQEVASDGEDKERIHVSKESQEQRGIQYLEDSASSGRYIQANATREEWCQSVQSSKTDHVNMSTHKQHEHSMETHHFPRLHVHPNHLHYQPLQHRFKKGHSIGLLMPGPRVKPIHVERFSDSYLGYAVSSAEDKWKDADLDRHSDRSSSVGLGMKDEKNKSILHQVGQS
ncbi:unnamed protein product [Protopolystoma xenopodis]|uniref:Uncharacterized protein n=1 Tax=Protopolystoma xenopodis TaxID=117903 RepID=A0A3S5BQ24_9PLAT|nr:unnamed protein product [Protopolystoma xenopodis]